MKIVAPIPCFNRFPLVELTASRLIRQGVTPILIGHENQIKEIANDLNIEFIQAPNSPLGNKWNKGFMACKNYNPDGVIFMGSSDWCSDDYIQSVNENLNDFNLLGMLGCHFVDVAEKIIGKSLNKEFVEKRAGDPDSLIADNSKIQNVLSFVPKYDDLNLIVKTAIDWEKHIVDKDIY